MDLTKKGLVYLSGVRLEPHVSRNTMSIVDVLKRINASEELFQIIVDENGHVVGTLTDGDIRRGLLAGVTLDKGVERFMKRAPRVATRKELASDGREILKDVSDFKFLPIIEENLVLHGVLVSRSSARIRTTGLIMAGGRGSRLGERTKTTPKPLLTVGGIPMIETVVRRLEMAGVDPIYISIHYLAERIKEWCESRTDGGALRLIHEDFPLGTAGALALIDGVGDGDVIVSNADVVTTIDFSAMLEFHRHLNVDATVAVARHEIDIPFGVVRADDQGRFLEIQEKPRITHFVSAGIYILGPEVRSLARPGVRLDMPELLDMARKAGLTIGVFPIHESWRDVGRPADLEAADLGESA